MSELNKVLLAFSDDIVKSAKRHLGGRKIGKNKNYGVASGQLKRSLSYKIRVRGNDIREVTFGAKGKADKYAAFIHFGVNGTRKNQKSPFSYRYEQPIRSTRDALKRWIKAEGYQSSETRKDDSRNKVECRHQICSLCHWSSCESKGIVGLRFYEKAYTAVSKRYEAKFGDAVAEDIAGKLKAKLGNITITN